MAENKEINRKFDRLINQLKSASLTDAEKVYTKNAVFNSIEDTPAVRNGKKVRLINEHTKRSILTNLIYKRMPVFLAIAMLFSGGVSFAAEGTLPGDLLYPVKVGVNENVGQVLAFSTEAKAEFEAKIAARRAEEMERLSESGEISPEVAEKLKINFELRAEKVRKHLAKLEANGKLGAAIEANSKFHDLLEKRIAIFKERIDEDGDESNKEKFREFSAKIRGEREKSASAQLDIEAKLKAGDPAGFEHRAEGKMKAAENKIAEVTKFIESKKDAVSAEVYADSSAKLNAANSLMAEAGVKLEAEAYGEAFVLFHKAFSTAMQAKEILIRGAVSELRAEIRLKIEEKRMSDDDREDEDSDEEDDEDEDNERRGNDRSAEVSSEGNAKVRTNGSETRGDARVKVKIGL